MIDTNDLQRVADWLDEAPRVLIGAGAGLSVAAGIDYTDTVSFARLYPGMVRRGFRACYELIGRHDVPAPAFWGYCGRHVSDVRFTPRVDPVHTALRGLTAHKDVFVVTSNVDALFVRHGFDADHVWTPQGDFAHIHCTALGEASCADQVWASEPIVDRLVRALDPATGEVAAGAVPCCPTCGGAVFFNVREDDRFLNGPYDQQAGRCVDWIRLAMDSPLLIVEIGAGFNTPGVVRWPLERLALRHPEARFVRINVAYPEVPAALGSRAIGMQRDAGEVLRALGARFTVRLA